MTIPEPVIVLCAPRSFSSVTAAMLGQHPDLYAFPELNLFAATSLGELIDLDNELGPNRGYTIGLSRAIAQLEFGHQTKSTVDDARRWLEQRRKWSTSRMFQWLKQRVAPRRAVDKSPRTALSGAACRRMFATIPEAHYIHLVRHPAASIRSLASTVRQQGSQVNRFFAQVWMDCQLSILEIMQTLDHRQTCRIRGEDLLNDPEPLLRELTLWLGLSISSDQIDAMKHPEQWYFAQSIPGVPDEDSDPSFRANPYLRKLGHLPSVQDIQELDVGKALVERIIRMSQELGYT